jgi:siroheme synthase
MLQTCAAAPGAASLLAGVRTRRRRWASCRAAAAAPADASAPPAATGRVWLVGAGPGGVEHLTIGASRVLASCDGARGRPHTQPHVTLRADARPPPRPRAAVVYDDLASEDILELTPPTAERVYMGKRGGGGAASAPQAAIDARLVQLALAGRRVVRLKGGCPSVFSRVASEARACAAAGVPFSMLPGVSSALAAPLLAGFPLTDATLSRTFAVASAHQLDQLDWAALAVVDTAVFLMGARALGAITDALRAAGRAASTPVAVVRWAGTPQQRVWEGTLESIAADTAGEALSPGAAQRVRGR